MPLHSTTDTKQLRQPDQVLAAIVGSEPISVADALKCAHKRASECSGGIDFTLPEHAKSMIHCDKELKELTGKDESTSYKLCSSVLCHLGR